MYCKYYELPRAGIWTQVCGMLKRHFTIKFRDKRRTAAEIFLPLYSLTLLIVLKLAVPNPNYRPEKSQPQEFNFVDDLTTLYTNKSTVAVAPRTPEVENFTNQMLDFYERHSGTPKSSNSIEFHYFNSTSDLIESYLKKPDSIVYAIQFEDIKSEIRYTLRANPTSVHHIPSTSDPYAPLSACRQQESQMEAAIRKTSLTVHSSKGGNNTAALFRPDADSCPVREYLTSGFLAMQYWIDATYLESQHTYKFHSPHIQLQQFPKDAFTGEWLVGLRIIIPIYIVMALSQFLTYLIVSVVGEKEKKLKEGMKIMGLRDPAYWFSWFFVYALLALFHASLTAFLLWWLQVFRYTDIIILYLLLISYSFSLIMFSFFLTPFFDKASSAGIVASFAVNIVSLLYFLQVFLAKSPTFVFWLISLMSSAGFTLAVDKALVMELSGEGVQWSNLWTNPDKVGLSVGESLVMMIVDILLYGFLAYYLDNVLPSAHGIRKPAWFFLKASFWNQKSIRRRKLCEGYANVNGTFVNEFTGLEYSVQAVEISPQNILEIDETRETIRVFLEESILNSDSFGEHIILDQFNRSEFLPNYGIITKKGDINLNNNYPLDGSDTQTSQEKDWNDNHGQVLASSPEPTHMEMTFPPLNRGKQEDHLIKQHTLTNGGHVKESSKVNGNADHGHEDDIEPVSGDLIGKEAIVIEDMSKEFKSKKSSSKALSNVNLTIYEGQITAILGHNGAGKTTLFNILTGLTMPSSGTAYVYGYDVTDPDGMAMIRRMTGVCPQSDLLFLLLTPWEHLEFYAHLKGIPKPRRKHEINKTIQDVNLEDRAQVLTKYLSGGQRRKLSVAIAILGDPKIIILDEPTAGVDPYSRRHMWSILQNKRPGRVILLTTHFMDEADILADRKAVISKGQIRCCGSSLFLKNKFGIGYHLTLVLDAVVIEESITSLVKSYIGNAEKTRRHGRELSYILPYNAVDKFADLFTAIEKEIKNTVEPSLGITSYGVSMTSLEEVFLQLQKDEQENEVKAEPLENTSKKIMKKKKRRPKRYVTLENESQEDSWPPDSQHSSDKVTPIGLEHVSLQRSSLQVFGAIFKLRLIRVYRDVQKLYIMVIIPLLFAGVGMYMHRNNNQMFEHKAISLTQFTDFYNESHMIAVNISSNFTNGNASSIQNFLNLFDNSTTLAYNGSYDSLLSYNVTTPLLGAIHVHSLTNVTLLYNDTCTHALPILMNVWNNVLDRYLRDKNSSFSSNGRVSWRPKRLQAIGPTARQRSSSTILALAESLPLTTMLPSFNTGLFSLSLFLGMVFVLIPVNMSTELVQDRENKSRNQLRVNGLGAIIYFLSHFLILVFLILLVYFGLLILIYLFNLNFLNNRISFLVMGFLVSCATPSLILFCTCVTYLFNRSDSARSIMPNVVTVFAFFPFLIMSTFHMYNIGNGLYQKIHFLFCLVDSIYLPYSIIYFMDIMHINCRLKNNCASLGFNDYLSNPDIQTILICSIIQIPILFLVLLYSDAKKSGSKHANIWKQLCGLSPVTGSNDYRKSSLRSSVNLEENVEGDDIGDEDVEAERQKVKDIDECNVVYNQPVVLLHNLSKTYNKGLHQQQSRNLRKQEKVAVNKLNLCIDQGEVFGLLGHNGAGKTTTLKIMTYEEMPTSGKAQIGGYNITTNFGSAFQLLGYCPQHNALWHNVTLREHMEVYAAIRGVPKFDIPRLVNSFIDGLHIEEHADKEVYKCSGGTKRKLSFALAMIGNPQIVLLDEPSTGMDPKSKRFLWDTILASFQGSRGALLTTHSMEEADALCSRVGIMVQGQLRCIGSTQHLKNRYGAGYKLEIKLRTNYNSSTNTQLHRRPGVVVYNGIKESQINTIQSSQSQQITESHQLSRSSSITENSSANKIKALIMELFNNQVLVEEEFVDRFVFSVPQAAVRSLAKAFVTLEKAKKRFGIEEYSFSQTTLEQVYLKFAQTREGKPATNEA